MKGSLHEYKHRSILPLTAVALAVYYGLVLVPLKRRAENLDVPLQKDWTKLCAALQQSNASTIDFRHITNQLLETRQDLAVLESARKKVAARLEPGAAVRAHMNAPFQDVEYKIERSERMDDLDKLASQQHVTINPAVFAGFPENTVDVKQPALLWAALSLVNGLLTTALSSNVVAIDSLQVPLALTNVSPVAADSTGQWTEVPIQLEFRASVAGTVRLLRSLPLRADEARAASLPRVPADKAPLFIDGLILKKEAPEKPGEVRVWLRAVGFVSCE
jgi:hypothetical protein